MGEELHASALRTSKRSLDCPVCSGEGKQQKRHKGMIIAEKHCRAVYSATKKTTNNSRARQVEATVYQQSCTGRMVGAYHNNVRLFGATKCALLPKHNYRGVVERGRISKIKTVYHRNTVLSSYSLLVRG